MRIAVALEELSSTGRDLVSIARDCVMHPGLASPASAPSAYRYRTVGDWSATHGIDLTPEHMVGFEVARELAPEERKFNCPPFCDKCKRCHDIGPCPAPVPAKADAICDLLSDAASMVCGDFPATKEWRRQWIEKYERIIAAKKEP